MATNNIKIFDQNKVNMLSDEAYNASTQRLSGVQQGIASSQLQNKTLYQVSLVAYSIGQMMQANGLNANDADAVSTFAGNLSNTIVQKILDKATTAEAKNYTVDNKFITPETWKAAYDFMKADSAMVTAATDDSHYITPKLLKEGAEKYGDKVRLDDGSLAQWKTFNKKVVNACNIDIEKVDQNDSLQVAVPDKLKRYYICIVFRSASGYELDLVDYKSGKIIDKKQTFTYSGNSYSFSSGESNRNYISALSENMLLVKVNNVKNNYISILAIDFSTGSFVVKKSIDTNLSYSESNNSYADKSKYFNNDLYYIYNVSRGKINIFHYNAINNTFSMIDISESSIGYSIYGINDDGSLYIVIAAGVYIPIGFIFCRIVGNTFSKYTVSFTSNDSRFYVQSKGNYVYVFFNMSNTASALYKINILTGNSVQKFTTVAVSYGYSLILVNDAETAVYINGKKYGSGTMDIEINELVSTFISAASTYGTSSVSSVLTYLASSSSIASVTNFVTKYKETVICSEINFVYDIQYAYFGAVVAES